MIRYLPIVLGVLVIVGLTIPQIWISDRFESTNVSTIEFAELLKNVPNTIGDWQGEDLPVEDQVRKTAGAVGRYVNRSYKNVRTGDEVNLWLICGHSRDICRHTPEICYPSSGFTTQAKENSLYLISYDGGVADFFTNTFVKEDTLGRSLVRVFWSWYRPREGDKIEWKAPEHPKITFGNSRALYKMYFTSQMGDIGETAEQSPCVRFARDVLPVVEKALANQQNQENVPTGEGTGDKPTAAAGAPAA